MHIVTRWDLEGMAELVQFVEAEASALDAMGWGEPLDVLLLERLNAFAASSIGIIERLLPTLLGRAKPIGRAIPPIKQVPARTPITEAEAIALSGERPTKPAAEDYQTPIPPLSRLGRWFGGRRRHEAEAALAKQRDEADFSNAMSQFEEAIRHWENEVDLIKAQLEQKLERRIAAAERHNAIVVAAEDRLAAGDFGALRNPIMATVHYMLYRPDKGPLSISLPDDLAVNLDSSWAIVRAPLPRAEEVVPPRGFRRTKSDYPDPMPRSVNEQSMLYRQYMAALALAVTHAVFLADQRSYLNEAGFVGLTRRIDPRTGWEAEVEAVSLRVSRTDLSSLRLDRVEPLLCAEDLGATFG